MMETTLVVFRRWRDTNSIIALFPAEPSDIAGLYCLSYERIGQHSGADYHGVIQATRPARIEEAALSRRGIDPDRLQPPAHQAGLADGPRAPQGHGTAIRAAPL